jgi:ATP-dependent helicase HepA
VPPELDALIEDVVVHAASRFGFDLEQDSGRRRWLVTFGYEALIDHLPHVEPGSSFRGTFDREEAVEDETLDFFASGHPLVEGILTELEEGPRGRVALLKVSGDEEAFGLLALYKRRPEWEAVAVDAEGRRRDDLAELLASREIEVEHVEPRRWTGRPGWDKGIRRLAAALPAGEMPQAVAAFRIRKT